MKKYILVLWVIIFASGCVSTPNARFRDFYSANERVSLDVAMDTLVLSDIRGRAIGINRGKNAEAIALVQDGVVKALEERGYTVNVLQHTNGLLLDPEPKKRYVYSEDWKSTGEVYQPIVSPDAESQWHSVEYKTFVKRLTDHARTVNDKNAMSSKKTPVIGAEEVPVFIAESPSDYFVFVRMNAGEIGGGKTVGVAVATGILSMLLTGGAVATSSTSHSGSEMQIVVFDKTTNTVRWENQVLGRNYKAATETLVNLMKPFPNTQGQLVKATVLREPKEKEEKPSDPGLGG